MPSQVQRGYVEIPLDQLSKARWNYKNDDKRMLSRLKANIRRNGQIENIIVRAVGELPDGRTQYEIVNGNHRYDALRELGMPVAMCFSVGEMGLMAAKRLAIETNETKFDMDKAIFGETLLELVDAFGMKDLQESMPLYEREMAEAIAEFDAEASKLIAQGMVRSEDVKPKGTVKSVGDEQFGGGSEATGSPLPSGAYVPDDDDEDSEGGSVGHSSGSGESYGGGESSGGEQSPRATIPSEAQRYKKLMFIVPESVYESFYEWVERLEQATGKRDENRAFEYAIVEALNIPEASLQ